MAATNGLNYRDRWELIYDELRRRIIEGELAPGARLPEADLADEFGVSRGPIREALRELTNAGLVVRAPRQPSYVAPVVASDVLEVYALRAAIEALAVRESIRLAPERLAELLRERMRAFEPATYADLATSAIVEADIAFHGAFYECAGNSRLLAVWHSISDPLRSMMRLATHRDDAHWRDSFGRHAEIARAVLDGDGDRAVALVDEHLRSGRDDLLQIIEASATP